MVAKKKPKKAYNKTPKKEKEVESRVKAKFSFLGQVIHGIGDKRYYFNSKDKCPEELVIFMQNSGLIGDR